MATAPLAHSKIVGGSTAARVIACPASVARVAAMPPKPSSSYADEGTLLHNAMALILDTDATFAELIGMAHENVVLTQDHIDEKIAPALMALQQIDPDNQMEYAVESQVDFGDVLPGVFGSADLIGRIGKRAIVLDWKFGNGVIVEAEENKQGLFYAAAAMRTPSLAWAFDGVEEIEIVIVQPPAIRRWVTTPERVKAFEKELIAAVRQSARGDAKFKTGEHCRWCAAKPTCPQFTGAVDRALKTSLEGIDAKTIGVYLKNADLLEDWIKSLRELAFQMLENDAPVPGYKLVAKRAVRSWADEKAAALVLEFNGVDAWKHDVISPAQAEKAFKKAGVEFPDDLVVAISSGSTLAEESDPRPAVINVGKQLSRALSKL